MKLTSLKHSSTFLPLPLMSPGEYTCQGTAALSPGNCSPVPREQQPCPQGAAALSPGSSSPVHREQQSCPQGAGGPDSWTLWCILSPCSCRLQTGKRKPVPLFNGLANPSTQFIEDTHWGVKGKDWGIRGSATTMDRKGVHFLINMLAIHQLVQYSRGEGATST